MAILKIIFVVLKGISWQVYCIIGLILFCIFCYWKGRSDMRHMWEADVERLKIEAQAMITANEERNRLTLIQQQQDSLRITETYNAEIATLKSRNFKLGGMLLGPNICDISPSSGEASSPKGSDGASSSGRVLSDESARNIEELVAQAEHDAATARACQAFIKLNEFPVEQ